MLSDDERKAVQTPLTRNVIYQVYPRSFKDSTGNGIGDLQGLIGKLDYLQGLGVDAIWFSPFFKSPQADFGYDVTDFCDIAPEYGTMADFGRLVKETHDRCMKVILDLVLNHTSDEHPWFVESASSQNNPKRDWYIWRDGRKPGGREPPNNWKAATGGPAWRYFENTDQWVYFGFLPFQPDLNYRNPEVKDTMFNILRFWLDKGVDGFRLDMLGAIYEDEQLRDNPLTWRILRSDGRSFLRKALSGTLLRPYRYNNNLPETFNFALELRQVMDEYEPKRILIGEVLGPLEETRQYYGSRNNGLDMVFLFEFTATPFKPHKYAEVIRRIERTLPFPYTPTYVLGNHDRSRFISRIDNMLKAKIAATMQLTLRGVPFIYYGEEIGMPNSDFEPKTSLDPLGRKLAWIPVFLRKWLRFSPTRDGCRTPMQWSDEPNAGFSPNPYAKTWLEISPTYKAINVAKQVKEPDSLLNCYQRLIKLRKENLALGEGLLELIELASLRKKCLAYRRIHENQEAYVYLNFSQNQLKLECPVRKPVLLFSTSANTMAIDEGSSSGILMLGPLEGIILQEHN